VGDDRHGAALGPPGVHVRPEFDVGAHVEPLIGLVEQEDGRVAEQGQGEVELLLLGAEQVEQVDDSGLLRAVAHAAVPSHRPGVRSEQSGAQLEQRGLARAVLADDRDGLAVVDVEVGPVEHGPAAVALDQAVGC
jgi:hypothetical protein